MNEKNGTAINIFKLERRWRNLVEKMKIIYFAKILFIHSFGAGEKVQMQQALTVLFSEKAHNDSKNSLTLHA